MKKRKTKNENENSISIFTNLPPFSPSIPENSETLKPSSMVVIIHPNTCYRGCCTSDAIPLQIPSSSYSLLSPIAKGSESTVFEATLDGRRVAAKKPVLSTSDDLDKFHRELQLLWFVLVCSALFGD